MEQRKGLSPAEWSNVTEQLMELASRYEDAKERSAGEEQKEADQKRPSR